MCVNEAGRFGAAVLAPPFWRGTFWRGFEKNTIFILKYLKKYYELLIKRTIYLFQNILNEHYSLFIVEAQGVYLYCSL